MPKNDSLLWDCDHGKVNEELQCIFFWDFENNRKDHKVRLAYGNGTEDGKSRN